MPLFTNVSHGKSQNVSNMADICSKKIKQYILSPSATKVISEEMCSHPTFACFMCY